MYDPPDPLQMSTYRHQRAALVARCAGWRAKEDLQLGILPGLLQAASHRPFDRQATGRDQSEFQWRPARRYLNGVILDRAKDAAAIETAKKSALTDTVLRMNTGS
jgi:hypothetical protein